MYSFSIIPLVEKLESKKETQKNIDELKQELEIMSIKSYSERNLALVASKFFIFIYQLSSNILFSPKAQNKKFRQLNLTDNFVDLSPSILTTICLSKDYQIFDFTVLPSFGDW